MNNYLRPGEVSAAYEALRAQATGRLSALSSRGLSLVLGSGLAAWVKAWAQPGQPPATAASAPAAIPPARAPRGHGVPDAADELVRLLAEMALGCWTKLAVPA